MNWERLVGPKVNYELGAVSLPPMNSTEGLTQTINMAAISTFYKHSKMFFVFKPQTIIYNSSAR